MKKENKEKYVSTIPATNWFLYRISEESHDNKKMRVLCDEEPLVAFLLFERQIDNKSFFSIYPATYDEVFNLDNQQQYVLKRPDGAVEIPAECTLDSIEECEEFLIGSDPENQAFLKELRHQRNLHARWRRKI